MKEHKYGKYNHITRNKHNAHLWIVKEENVEISDNCWIGAFVVLDGTEKLKIGKETSIACGVHIYTHSTAKLHVSEGETPKKMRPIEVGEYAAIGANAVVVMANVGHHSIVQALSLVLDDVQPYTIVAGNPAKKIGDVKNK